MVNFTLMTAMILCSFSWISVSGSHSVTIQPGEDVTLLCPNVSNYDAVSFWFRLINGSQARCISVMITSKTEVEFCGGFQNKKYEISSNITVLFLKIKQVDLSDSGLYFCGFYAHGRPIFSVKHLNVEGSDEAQNDMESKQKDEFDTIWLISMILGALTFFLLVVIVGLVVQIGKLQTAHKEEQRLEQLQNPHLEDLNYAAVAFRPKAKQRQMEPNVIYSATR
uniref:Immunoglobulin domain-containing protein n=1 Tax=Anabas testudineus TaxID=64144 RepID=A0A3Q1J859_ANATE